MPVDAGSNDQGIWVRDEFLTPSRVRSLLDCAIARRDRGDFQAARIGAGAAAQRHEEIRGDSTCWITPPVFPAEQSLLDDLETLRLELNRATLLSLFDLELHYACYAPGAGYARHVDQPVGRAQRQVSLVLYLNEDWAHAAGGELRLFVDGDGARDFQPIAGRLVYFLTPGREHAVLPAQRQRWSVTGWFRTRG